MSRKGNNIVLENYTDTGVIHKKRTEEYIHYLSIRYQFPHLSINIRNQKKERLTRVFLTPTDARVGGTCT